LPKGGAADAALLIVSGRRTHNLPVCLRNNRRPTRKDKARGAPLRIMRYAPRGAGSAGAGEEVRRLVTFVLAGLALIVLAVALAVVLFLKPSWTRAVLVGLAWALVLVGVWLLGRHAGANGSGG
jgi:hypothetical protein